MSFSRAALRAHPRTDQSTVQEEECMVICGLLVPLAAMIRSAKSRQSDPAYRAWTGMTASRGYPTWRGTMGAGLDTGQTRRTRQAERERQIVRLQAAESRDLGRGSGQQLPSSRA
ncbi:hypothetical protein BO71DRAFT_13476 [Aspergillus ellipticus CBS 707.79]|uniref:Uncharacterized protein n=1 Tax=Aspergillus ellipticus CBS 707.79 TaxID=1448320 RepID=A0A319EDI2_9EURO|nr:hypothetical protein BO71DRAFT_13476 [Aspergillus ellipticus CBS 707.79]